MTNLTLQYAFLLCQCGTHGIIVFPDYSVSPRVNNVEEVEVELNKAEAEGKVTHDEATKLWFQASESVLPAGASSPLSFSDIMMQDRVHPAEFAFTKKIIH